MNKKQLLLATNNKGKIIEFEEILQFLPDVTLLSPKDLGIVLDVDEIGTTYEENSLLKANAFCKASGLICLADDSGLEVEALNGAPGLFSARYSSKEGADDKDRRDYLVQNLTGHQKPWNAHFTATVSVAIPEKEPIIGLGEVFGEIIPEERGVGGFGYDPIFLINQLGKTMAELDSTNKNKISHRARAIESIAEHLEKLFQN